MKTYHDLYLDLPVGRLKCLHNGIISPTRVLCLHGWLDNRASFLPMLPYLDSVECVAVDLPGHGESAHRNADSLLHYVDYVRDIKLMIDALNWPDCHLLGHSMGGALSLIAASTLPETVTSLAMIDSLHPLSRDPHQSPAMLRRAVDQFTAWDPLRETLFPSLKTAVRARLNASPFPQSEQSARLLMEYATEKTATGYRLRSDARLNFRSALMLSPEQIEAFIAAVAQPALVILGKQGIIHHRRTAIDSLALFQNVQHHIIEGGHHLHMEDPARVTDLYLAFLDTL